MISVAMRLRLRLAMVLVLLVAVVLLAPAPQAQAQQCVGTTGPGVYQVYRAGTEGQWVVSSASLSQIVAKTNEMIGQGWYLHTIDGWADGCENEYLYYTAVYKPGVIDQIWHLHWKRADFEARNNELRGLGWRLVALDTQMYKNVLTYNGIWRKGTADQIDYFAWKRADFEAENNRLRAQGWRMTFMDTFQAQGSSTRYYNAIFRKSTREQIDLFGWSKADFVNKYNELGQQGWRISSIEAGGGVSGSFVKSSVAERLFLGSERWEEPHFIDKSQTMFNNGWRIYKLSYTG